jgi:hypothetical protein
MMMMVVMSSRMLKMMMERSVGKLVTSPKDSSGPATADGYCVAPVWGVPSTQHWCNNSSLPLDHVMAGNMESAYRLLLDQVWVVDFSPYQQHFLSTFSRSLTMFSCLASTLPHHHVPPPPPPPSPTTPNSTLRTQLWV